jgi:hypothetical protein
MATGALVPHVLPNGKTVMVPDYLAPKGPGALAMPAAAPRPPGPDMRLASKGPAPILSQLSPDFAKVQQFSNSKPDAPSPLAQAVVPPPEDAEQRRKRIDSERVTEAAREAMGKKDPKTLKQVPKSDPRAESGVIANTASDLYRPKTGGVGAPKADPENLRPVVAEIKQERTPGQRLLPEQEWRMGLSERPSELYEVDPDAEQPTWGADEPVMREKLTPLEKGAKSAGLGALSEHMRQERQRQAWDVAQRDMLVKQSELVDEQLTTIAQRRDKIAKLQEVADKRMQEAESFEPRMREQVWQDKGPIGMVMGLIAIALGGAQGGLLGTGKNAGWDMVNKAIDDAVEGDRYKAERRRKIGLDAKGDYEKALALYGDTDMALLETKNRKLASTMTMLQQHLQSKGLDETSKMRGQQLLAAAEEQYFTGKQHLLDQITGKVTKEEATLKPYGQVLQSATPKPTGGGGGGSSGGVTGDKLKGLSSEIRSMAVKLPDGRYKFVRQPTQQAQTQKRVSSLGEMGSVLQQIQHWRQDKGKTLPLGEARGRIANLGARFTMLVKGSEQLGALDKGTMDFMLQMLGSPEQFNVIDSTTDGKIAQQLDTVNRNIRKVVEEELDDGPFDLTEGGVTPDEVKD